MKTIEFHILQNFPPSNLNRDDSGAPKDCDFGGYRRQRISSQCLKRSARGVFQENTKVQTAVRTKKAPSLLREKLIELGFEEVEAENLASGLLGVIHGLDDDQTKVILNYGDEELVSIAQYVQENTVNVQSEISRITDLTGSKAKKAKLQFAKKVASAVNPQMTVSSIDIALFGRMLASSPTENINAACQVSHAISVNRMNMEFDYFTAVDDIPDDDNTGAAMIGTLGFSSSCFYRFACVDMDQLSRNLGGDAQAANEGVLAFAEAFVQARPSGKQNTFAAHSLPALVMVVMRESGQPVSLVNAFENPIKPGTDKSLTSRAIDALGTHYGKLQKMYVLNGQAAYVMLDADEDVEKSLSETGVRSLDSIPALLDTLKSSLTTNPATT